MCRVTRPLLDAVLPFSPNLPLSKGQTQADALAATMAFWIDTKYAENKNLAMALLRVQVAKATNSRAVSEALLAAAKDDTHDLHRALSVLDKVHRKELLAIISP